MSTERKVVSLEQLVRIREELRAQGKVVVQCHGCFDIVHPGHIRYLNFARQHGDALIVSVSGDDVVGKGVDRPYINERLRAENLAALEVVDWVVIDHDTWAGPVLEAVRPDVFVKGREYESNADPRFIRERQIVEEQGGSVLFSSGDVVYSSTSIIEAYRERFDLENERLRFYCDRHGIDRAKLDAVLHAAQERRILVVGDPILDCYVHCEAASIASEGPILSVVPVEEVYYAGGAALVARQLSAFGAAATLVTPMGTGADEDRFAAAVSEWGVRLETVAVAARPAFRKQRYLVDTKKVFKVDHGRHSPLSSVETRATLERIEAELPHHDGVIVTDFGMGLFGPALVEGIQEACQRSGVPLFADVSGGTGHASIVKFRRPRLATPTEAELRYALGDSESGLAPLAARYFDETRAEQLVITLGRRGAVLFTPPPEGDRLISDFLPALAPHEVDAVGAGDVFLASMVLADLSAAGLSTALYLASVAAAAQVRALGNDPVRLDVLRQSLSERPELHP